MAAVVRNTATLAVIVVCPNCKHDVTESASQWIDSNGDVYFSASHELSPLSLVQFINDHS